MVMTAVLDNYLAANVDATLCLNPELMNKFAILLHNVLAIS